MTQYKLKLEVSRRARAVVRAQRWAFLHAPKPRPSRRPWIIATAAIGIGLVIGGLLSVGFPRDAGRDRQSWLAWLINAPETAPAPAAPKGAWTVAQGGAGPEDVIQLQQLIIEAAVEDSAATPVYEELLVPDETLQWRAPPSPACACVRISRPTSRPTWRRGSPSRELPPPA